VAMPEKQYLKATATGRGENQDHIEADEKHQRDIQMAENNDDLNKTIQIKQPYPK